MKAIIEKNVIKLSFPYDKEMVKFCQVMAMRWSKVTHLWSMPDNYMNRRCLNIRYPGILPPEPREEPRELVVPSFLMDHQGEALRRNARQGRRGVFHDTGCHAKGTKILMADGHIKKVEDVITGDFLMGENGFRRVLELRRGTETMYRIIPTKGDPFVVNESHILSLYKTGKKYIKGSYKEKGWSCHKYYHYIENISIKNYIGKTETYKRYSKLRRSDVKEFAQNTNKQTFILRPYHLGLFLGDGTMQRQVAIHNQHAEIFVSVQEIANQFGLRITTRKTKTTKSVSHHLAGEYGKLNPLMHEFRKLGVDVHCRNKFIPFRYKVASYNDRLELLAGLIDTDGYLRQNNSHTFTSASKKLADDVAFLCKSVGLYVNKSKRILRGVCYYGLHISGDIAKIPCHRGGRQAKPQQQKINPLNTNFTVEKLPPDNYYGFTLDGDHLYLTNDFIVHHNCGKTITALETYRHHNVKTLIICPLSLIEGAWMDEINNPLAWIKDATPEIEAIRAQYKAIDVVNLWAAKKRSPSTFNKALEKNLGIINYESFRTIDKKLARAGYKMVILDESAKIRTYKRGTTADKIIEFCDNVKYVLELSGVPAPNNMLEYWTQIRILDPLLWGKSFYKFRTKYFLPSGYGGYKWKVKEEYEKKLIEDIKTVAEYVDKGDVLDLPGTVESKRIFKLSKKEWSHYKDIKANLITILESGEKITSPSAVTAQMKLRQISSGFILDTTTEEINGRIKKTTKAFHLGNTKLNELISLLEDIGKKQVLIWIEFKEEANIISKKLSKMGLTTGILNGTIPEKQKQVTLKAFKGGDLQYAICHPKSVGFGHTMVSCNESICYSNSYSYDNAKQLKDRIYRQGQKVRCSYYYLLADKTLDPVILEAVRNKKDISMATLNYLKK